MSSFGCGGPSFKPPDLGREVAAYLIVRAASHLQPDTHLGSLLDPLMDQPPVPEEAKAHPGDVADGQFIPTRLGTTPEESAKAADNLVKQILNEAPKAAAAEVQDAALPTQVKTVALNSNKLLASIPFIAWLLYKSKETHLRNINIHIKATNCRKIYRIKLGKGDVTQSVAFKVKAGSPVRFLAEPAAHTEGELPPPLFQPTKNFLDELLGPLAFRRQEFNTDCNIFIDDYDKLQHDYDKLKKGTEPTIVAIPLSANEGLRVIHRNPHKTGKAIPFDVDATDDETAGFASLTVNTIDVTKSDKCNARIPLGIPDQDDTLDEFVHIEQVAAE